MKIGILSGFISAIAFTSMAVLVRTTNGTFTTGQLMISRALLGILVFGLWERKRLKDLVHPNGKFVFLRAIFGGISVVCYYQNLRITSVSNATILSDLAPVMMLIISVFIANEAPTRSAITGVILATIGTTSLASPSVSDISTASLIIGLVGALIGGMAYLSLKAAAGQFSSRLVVFCFSISILIIGIFLNNGVPWPEFGVHYFPLIGVAILSLIAQLLMTYSYKVLSAFSASSIGLSAVIWALLFDTINTSEMPSWKHLTAVMITLIGIQIAQTRPAKQNVKSENAQGETIAQ